MIVARVAVSVRGVESVLASSNALTVIDRKQKPARYAVTRQVRRRSPCHNYVLRTLEHSLSVGRAAVLETVPLLPQDHKSGTVCRPISDYVGCHVEAVTEDIFIRTVRPRRSVNCFQLRRIEIFLLTYLLTYLLAACLGRQPTHQARGYVAYAFYF